MDSQLDMLKDDKKDETTLHLRAPGNCMADFKAWIEILENDTLNFIVKRKPKLITQDGLTVEVQGATCFCVFDYDFIVKTATGLTKEKILFNRKTVNELSKEAIGDESNATEYRIPNTEY